MSGKDGKDATPRMTLAMRLVLAVMLEDPTREMYGLQICQAAGLQPGSIYHLLLRLVRIGWLQSRWEDVDPREQGRPQRRYYRLTPQGTQRALAALAHVSKPAAVLARCNPGLATGAHR